MTTKVAIVNFGPMPVEVRTRSLITIAKTEGSGLDIFQTKDSAPPILVNPGEVYTGYYVHQHQSIIVDEKMPS